MAVLCGQIEQLCRANSLLESLFEVVELLTFSLPAAFGLLLSSLFCVNVEVSNEWGLMTSQPKILLLVVLTLAAGRFAAAQAVAQSADAVPAGTASVSAGSVSGGARPLLDFENSDVKFNLQSLMSILRDGRHEGWVLAAYPDPQTKRPLIGAGFSLDVPVREHAQKDPLNPHPFAEPSSEQLWEAAGLEPERLDRILDRYDRDLKTWTAKKYRKKIRTRSLTPQITDEEAMRLLRVSAIQAIYNAKAYCRDFDQLTAPQQMALSQLVFQMGVNLEEFVQFLGALNGDATVAAGGQTEPVITGIAGAQAAAARTVPAAAPTDGEHWRAVQGTLIDSQWARLYSNRASTVIAMFDPAYVEDPSAALHRVNAVLQPPPARSRGASTGSLRTTSYRKRVPASRRAATSLKHKRKVG
jgi:hypothetical protein